MRQRQRETERERERERECKYVRKKYIKNHLVQELLLLIWIG